MTQDFAGESKSFNPFDRILGQLEAMPKAARRTRVLGISGCQPGDGVTYVLRGLAAGIAVRNGRRVLCVDCSRLQSIAGLTAPGLLSRCSPTQQRGVWEFSPTPSAPTAFGDLTGNDLNSMIMSLSSNFDVILLDLGAVTTSGSLWRFGLITDQVLLVVAAGETKRAQIAHAQTVIAQAGARLSGCLLNKRTYPLPRALYRALN